MRVGLSVLVMVLTAALLASCASRSPAQLPASSTTGTILIRTGEVTDVRDAMELTVRFDNGDVRTYSAQPGEHFRIGDTVTVTTGNGVTRVTQADRPAQPSR